MNNNANDVKHLPVFKLDGRRNKMEFIRGFPGIADHYGVREMIYGNVPRPDAGDNLAERQVAWDNMNRVALEKLRFYVTVRVDDMVTQGEDITAREYFRRLDGLFLRTGAGSVSSLNRRLAACTYQQGEEVFEWLAKLDSIYAQFRAAGAEIPDQEKKHRAMGLISDVPTWGSMAHLLGTSDAVSYTEWREAMLRKEEEFEQNGEMSGQKLADELYGVRQPQENALPATTLHQTFRGSGFRGGRVIPRGWPARNNVAKMQGRGRGTHGFAQSSNVAVPRGGPRGNMQFNRGRASPRGSVSRSVVCFTCGGFGHSSAQCPTDYGNGFQGTCRACGQWGHQSRYCNTQHTHVSTDEFEQAPDGYPYYPQSDYYDSYNNDAYTNYSHNYQQEQEDVLEHEAVKGESTPGIFNLMVRVLDSPRERAVAVRQHSVYDINLDSYCTRHMTPCFSLEQPQPCQVDVMVGLCVRLGNVCSG